MAVLQRIKQQDEQLALSEQEPLASLSPYQTDKLLKKHPVISVEYEALCIRITALLKQANQSPEDLGLLKVLNQTILEARILNQRLIELYGYTNAHGKQKKRLEEQQEKLRFVPEVKPEKNEEPIALTKKEQSWRSFFSKKFEQFRQFITENNPIRLFFARMRRLFANIKGFDAFLANTSELLSKIYQGFDTYFFAPVMSLLSWLYLLPRMIINLGKIFWHTLYHDKLKEGEKQLTWKQRLRIQWRERWFELANDFVWVIGNFLVCFVLLGALSFAGLMVAMSIFVWDVAMAIIRASIEIPRLSRLISEHEALLSECKSPEEKKEQENFIQVLKQHRSYEIKRQALTIINTSLVTVFSFFALSVVNITPMLPIISATLWVMLSIVMICLNAAVNKTKPTSKLESLDMSSYDTLMKKLPQAEKSIEPDLAPQSQAIIGTKHDAINSPSPIQQTEPANLSSPVGSPS